LSKIVITTKLGLEGIYATHKKELLIADTEAEFLDCLKLVHAGQVDLIKMGHAARQFVENQFSFSELAKQLKKEMTALV